MSASSRLAGRGSIEWARFVCHVAVAIGCGAAIAQVPGTAWRPPAGVQYAVQPGFPADVRGLGHSDGHAVVVVTIDETGRVMDGVALEASHPAFAAAAELAVVEWVFDPLPAPMRPRRELLQFEFRSEGTVTQLSHADSMAQQLAPPVRENRLRTVLWSQLESPPAVLDTASAVVPRAVVARLAGKTIPVSFVVDTQGRVRVPTVDAGVDAQAAHAILQAMSGWRFAPPKLAGQPVLAQAERNFGGAGAEP